MSRRSRRKRGAAPETEDDEGEKKNSKVDPLGLAAGVSWEWEGDGGHWTAYSPKHTKTLTDALVNGDREVTLKVTTSVKMKVRFEAMTQTNVGTGWQRNVRCVKASSSSTSSKNQTANVWEWERDDGNWVAYLPVQQRLLNACKLCEVKSVKIEAAPGKWSTVDLKAMKQESEVGDRVWDIRCSQLAVWQWQNEHSQWMTYDSAVTMELERECVKMAGSEGGGKGGKVAITAADRGYTVDVVKMEQKNDATGVVRKIRKLKPVDKTETSSDVVSTSSEATPTSSAKAVSTTTSKTTPPSTSTATPTSCDAATGSSKSKATTTESTDGSGHVTRKYQGNLPVDYVCSQKVGKAHVYSEDGVNWDAMLNQTNVKNNNNKFYILQLLKDDTASRYSTWFRWGRVGKTGQHSLTDCGSDVEQAKDIFRKKFHDKTLNDWEDRDSFAKQAGKYDLLKMDYKATEEVDGEDEGGVEEVDGEGQEVKEKTKPPESKLDNRLQALMELICDVKAMEDAVIEMKYDPKKAPLGKLTKDQIHSGYAALKKIDDCISRGQLGDPLVRACDQFYTRVPHDFGMKRPPIIRTKEEVKEKLALLETLGDIEIAMRVLKEGDRTEHPVDRHYHGLHCKLEPLDREDDTFQLVEKYVRQTHAKTHNQYTLTVKEVFDMDREREAEDFKDVGNRQLLWHGSRLTNWVSILNQGLRIAPPEAPITGYMFGKGVYFADMCSKSANYCFASRTRKEGLLILCDVALGQTYDLLAADYHADQLPRGKHSTKGLGRIAPDPAHNQALPDGCLVPLGNSVDTGVHNPSGYTLNYNGQTMGFQRGEYKFVVYDTKQIKMRYLVRAQFNFK